MLRILFYILLLASMATPASAQGFSNHSLNGVQPTKSNGSWTFSLEPGGCSDKDYGDGRGESDCVNGNLRSRIWSKKSFKAPVSKEYAFDILIPSDFTYEESLSYRPRGSIEVAEWNRINAVKNHMYEMHLTNRGVTFEDKVCFGDERFGTWNSVKIQAHWSNDSDGFMRVFCNNALVYSSDGPNLVPPGCGTKTKSNCKLESLDLSKPIQWTLGPNYRGFGGDWAEYGRSSPFLPFPANGIKMQVTNVYEGKIR
jgi:hypothetical protein